MGQSFSFYKEMRFVFEFHGVVPGSLCFMRPMIREWLICMFIMVIFGKKSSIPNGIAMALNSLAQSCILPVLDTL